MNWKIGQKLVCIDGYGLIVNGEIYTYDGPSECLDDPGQIYLAELQGVEYDGRRYSWLAIRFREVVDIGDEVEEYIKSKIQEPEYA